MARSAKIYDFTIPANGSFTLLVEGSYYRILSSSGALEVKRDGGSGVGPIYAGQGERDEEFKRITLVDKTGAINSGYIIISDGTFVDDRITGEVSVIDGGKARTLSNAAFAGTSGAAAVAANIPSVGLWNPAGSGKNAIIETILLSSTTTQVVRWGSATVAIGTIFTGYPAKKVGGTQAVSQITSGNLAGFPTGWQYYGNINLLANTPLMWAFKEPIVVPPGFAFGAQGGTLNTDMQVNLEFFEEPI